MNDFMMYHYLGIGDHLMCDGLVRALYKKYDGRFKLIAKRPYAKNIDFMYRDLSRLDVVYVQDDREADVVLNSFNGEKKKLFGPFHKDEFYEKTLYRLCDLDPSCRYTEFYVERDYKKEQELYNSIMKKDNYIVIADDPIRGYRINVKADPGVQIIRTSEYLEYGIFDFMTVLENAKEIHAMYSAFLILADLMNLKTITIHESYLRKIYPAYPTNPKLIEYWLERGVGFV